jgi:hypothetical protein
MARYCGNCGTEVDDTAVFCPTCGQPVDEATAADIPAAPAWPDAAPANAASRDEPDEGPSRLAEERARQESVGPHADLPRESEPPVEPSAKSEGEPAERWREYGRRDFGAAPVPESEDAPTRIEQRPPAPADAGEGTRRAPPPDARAPQHSGRSGPGSPQVELPFTMPVTLSGWLIGGGTLLAALGVVIILIVTALNAIDLLLLVALVAVAATVFLSSRMPAIPNLRLIGLVVALIAFGIALDRVGFRGGGAGELLLFMGAAAAAIGAVVLEIGQDQPLGGPQR